MEHRTASGCPSLDHFDPFSHEHLAKPDKIWREARKSRPVVYMPDIDHWAITRYEDVQWVIRDTQTFSSLVAIDQGEIPPEFAEQLPEGFPQMWPTLLNNDPPHHTRVRKLSQRALTPRAIAAREGEIRAIAHDLVDAFAADGAVDIMSAFAIQLPLTVIIRVLGLEGAPPLQIKSWSDESLILVNPTLDKDYRRELSQRAGVDFHDFIIESIERHRASECPGLLADLVRATTDEGEAVLTTRELESVVAQLIIGGTETTTNLIGNMLLLLEANPDTKERVKNDLSLVPGVVEESLRLKSSIKAIRRTTTREVEVAGTTLPAGAKVLVTYFSANRDDAMFPDPERFDIDRPNVTRHLGFGKGAHFCIGAPLARVEARVGLETLLERLPELHVVPGQQLEYFPSFVAHGVRQLDVEWQV